MCSVCKCVCVCVCVFVCVCVRVCVCVVVYVCDLRKEDRERVCGGLSACVDVYSDTNSIKRMIKLREK